MTEVTYNEEITATELNDMAVDLGKTDFSYFENEMPYAVSQLNKITADLVSPGVLRTGANGDLGCEVIASGSMAYVQAGVIVFESGAKIRITEPVGVGLVSGTVIYALYDSTTGKASLEVSETTPSGDYVLLAEVKTGGVITDRRSGCVANVVLNADTPNTYKEVTVTLENVRSYEQTFKLDMGTNAYRYICFLGGAVKHTNGREVVNTYLQHGQPFLSEEGVVHELWTWIKGNVQVYYLTRNGQYQEIVYSGGGGAFWEGTHTLRFLVI